jgi:hypothetical protein
MFAISAGPLWRDEANTVGLATLPTFGDIWKNLQYDSFPLLWLLIIRGVSSLVGPMNDPAFRILGFLVGVGLIAVLWVNARTLRHSFPLVSLALLAMSPSVIIWGDSMRAYGFGIVLILLTGALLWRFVEKPDGWRFVAAAIGAIASVHTLYYNSVLLLAFCAGAVAVCLLKRSWKTAALVALIGCLAAISIMPYVATIRTASSWNVLVQMNDYKLAWFREKLDETLRPAGPWALKVWVGLFGFAVLAGARAVRLPGQLGMTQRQREAALFALVTLVVGVLAEFLFLRTLRYFTQPWYYLTLLALVGVCIDAVFGAVLQTPQLRMARLFAVLLIAGATLPPAVRALRHRMSNVDLVVSRLHEIAERGDLVLVHQWYAGVTFNRYYHGPSRWMTVPPIGYYRFHRYDILQQQMMVSDQTLPARQVTTEVSEALRAGHRVFIVGTEFHAAAQPPALLRPAPLPGAAPWPYNSYLEQWGSIVGQFLKQHSTALVPVRVEARGPVSGYENIQLFVASGWRP